MFQALLSSLSPLLQWKVGLGLGTWAALDTGSWHVLTPLLRFTMPPFTTHQESPGSPPQDSFPSPASVLTELATQLGARFHLMIICNGLLVIFLPNSCQPLSIETMSLSPPYSQEQLHAWPALIIFNMFVKCLS